MCHKKCLCSVSNTIYFYEPNRPLAFKKTLNYYKEHVKLQGNNLDLEVKKTNLKQPNQIPKNHGVLKFNGT